MSAEKENEIWLNFTDTYGTICYRKSDGRQLTTQNEEHERGILTAVRYGWTNYGVANLYNAAGLPLAPFTAEV